MIRQFIKGAPARPVVRSWGLKYKLLCKYSNSWKIEYWILRKSSELHKTCFHKKKRTLILTNLLTKSNGKTLTNKQTRFVKQFVKTFYLYNNLSICVSPCVCPYAIYSLSFGLIWSLKVPMDFLGPGGGNKTIWKVMGPKMKKKILLETPLLILLPT